MSSSSATASGDPAGLHASSGGDSRSSSPQRRLQKLLAVPGLHPNRVNDLLLLRPKDQDRDRDRDPDQDRDPEEEHNNRHVVFFHGDIQSFREEMSSQPDLSPWLSWSLEDVALTLGRRFPDRFVWIVRASLMYLHKFSCYRNFVDSNMFGAPEHQPYAPDLGAFHHLRALLSHGMQRAQLPAPPHPRGASAPPPGFSLVLVGFSKGCVVLNQLLYELPGARADPQMCPFVNRISDVFWLDGGHPGGRDTWVTDRRVLGELAVSGVRVHAHVTPYEVRDPMRAWVGREHALFIQTLEELGARPQNTLHFQDQLPSIHNHFRIIQEF